MNPVHIHLITNHLPVTGTLFATLILAYALISAKEEIQKLALAVLVVLAIVTPLVFFSGEKAEGRVELIAGIQEGDLEKHEEAGEAAFALMEGLGVLAFFQLALFAFPNTAGLRRKSIRLILLIAALVTGWMFYTANTGGRIRHGEEMGAPTRP
jgi:hypothetical protein